MATDTEIAHIRALNDCLRTTHTGGQVVVTAGINALGLVAVTTILKAVAAFDSFSADNDPHGEHDCATLTIDDLRILWKIDYYDTELQYHSPNPADASVTTRVMTIMLAEEY